MTGDVGPFLVCLSPICMSSLENPGAFTCHRSLDVSVLLLAGSICIYILSSHSENAKSVLPFKMLSYGRYCIFLYNCPFLQRPPRVMICLEGYCWLFLRRTPKGQDRSQQSSEGIWGGDPRECYDVITWMRGRCLLLPVTMRAGPDPNSAPPLL